MAKKGFGGGTCAYCRGSDAPTVGEHVFGRKFFLPRHRHRLPKVAACESCNTRKSQLEGYILTMAPLAGNHATAREYAEENLERRLAANLPLQRGLVSSIERGHDGLLRYSADSATLLELALLWTSGLFAYHFRRPLHPRWEPRVRHVTAAQEAEGSAALEMLVAPDPETVHRDLGEGTVSYSGQRSHRMPYCSTWRFVLFGGMTWTGNPEAPEDRYSAILCATFRRTEAPAEIDTGERDDWRPAVT